MKLGGSQSLVQIDTGQHYYEVSHATVAESWTSPTSGLGGRSGSGTEASAEIIKCLSW